MKRTRYKIMDLRMASYIRCEVAFDVEVKADDGKTYYPLKLELLPGDFLNNPQGEMKTFQENEKYFKLR